MKKVKVAVLGSTGLVGQQFVRLLAGHPWCEIVLLSGSARSTGKRYGDAAPWEAGGTLPRSVAGIEVAETSVPACLGTGARVVFSALPAQVASSLEAQLREEGIFVFSNASAHRMDSDVPVVVPEINPDHLDLTRVGRPDRRGFIVTNSNCSTAGLALALAPLRAFGIRAVTVSTYQSISGAGRRGLAAMAILGNAVPYIEAEEEKIERETGKIFGRLDGGSIAAGGFEINASACRVPVREGHLESVFVELERCITETEAARAFGCFRGLPQELGLPSAPHSPLIVRPEPDRPQCAIDAWAGEPEHAAGMAVSIGRIRAKGRGISYFLLVHNLVRGAAGNCVLTFELALKKGCLE